jgi:WD40 repeat protein
MFGVREKRMKSWSSPSPLSFSSIGHELALCSFKKKRGDLQHRATVPPPENDVVVLDVDTLKPTKFFTLYTLTSASILSYIPNRNYLIAGGAVTAKLVNVNTGKVTELTEYKKRLAYPQISPDGRHLAIAIGNDIEIWRLN